MELEFFLKISDSLKYLITNYHIINNNTQKVEIEICNKKQIELNLRNYSIKYFDEPKDITAIYIKDTFELYNDVNFLYYDLNYLKGYLIYKGVDVFSLQYPNGNNAECASGVIEEIFDKEFYHSIPTDNGSSGSPVILLNNNINSLQVIGVHKSADNRKKLNCGTFIGEIIAELNNKPKDNFGNNQQIIKKGISKEKTNINKNSIIIGKNDLSTQKNMINIDNNIIDNNLVNKKAGKVSTTIKDNKMNFGHEKYKNMINPKTEIKRNKIDIDTKLQITKNKNHNQKENKPEINKFYINSINEVRLPKGLVDISFDTLKAE